MSSRVSRSFALVRMLCVIVFAFSAISGAAQESNQNRNPREMQLTEHGLMALSTPKGWERRNGPGLLFFVKKGAAPKKLDVWIYVSEIAIGPNEDAKSGEECIESDMAGFRARFKNGTVRTEEPLMLPNANTSAQVRTFESGESNNPIEQVVYITEATRVLTLVLSAKNRQAYTESLAVFHEFAKSYNGSIIESHDSTHP